MNSTQRDLVAAEGHAPSGREWLLHCAEQVFGARGSAGRVEDVAAAAGVAKSLVFRHWPTKEALLDEVTVRARARYAGWIEHACWSRPDDTVGAVADAAVGFFRTPRNGLFDPLVSPVDPAAATAPELIALAGPLDEAAHRVGGASTASEVRLLLDAAAVGTVRGWMGTPSLTALDHAEDVVRTAIRLVIEGGLASLRPVGPVGRRPRRASRVAFGDPSTPRGRRESALLEAALVVFARDGYDDARLEDIAAAVGYTTSTLFGYWPGKQALFLRLRAEVSDDVSRRLLAAVDESTSTAEALRAAIGAQVRTHYDHPDYQPILLPVLSLPREADLESAGWYRTVALLSAVPELAAAGDVVPLATAIGLSVLRNAVRTMHQHRIHPAVTASIIQDYLVGGLGALADAHAVDLA